MAQRTKLRQERCSRQERVSLRNATCSASLITHFTVLLPASCRHFTHCGRQRRWLGRRGSCSSLTALRTGPGLSGLVTCPPPVHLTGNVDWERGGVRGGSSRWRGWLRPRHTRWSHPTWDREPGACPLDVGDGLGGCGSRPRAQSRVLAPRKRVSVLTKGKRERRALRRSGRRTDQGRECRADNGGTGERAPPNPRRAGSRFTFHLVDGSSKVIRRTMAVRRARTTHASQGAGAQR